MKPEDARRVTREAIEALKGIFDEMNVGGTLVFRRDDGTEDEVYIPPIPKPKDEGNA